MTSAATQNSSPNEWYLISKQLLSKNKAECFPSSNWNPSQSTHSTTFSLIGRLACWEKTHIALCKVLLWEGRRGWPLWERYCQSFELSKWSIWVIVSRLQTRCFKTWSFRLRTWLWDSSHNWQPKESVPYWHGPTWRSSTSQDVST